MILEALVRQYEQLTSDPDSGIAAYGYSLQKIGFCVVLNPDGSLHAIEPRSDESSGKPRPVQLVVPGQSKPSGSGINPCLLWDNSTYMLGHAPEGRDAAWAMKRFEGFRDRHLAIRDQVEDPAFDAVCQFLEAWKPAQLDERPDTDPLEQPGFGVFQVRGQEEYVHQRAAVQGYWQKQLDCGAAGSGKDEIVEGVCLVTGEAGPLARLHEPKIKGVAGGQSSGATLVSFNLDAFDSRDKKQGINAPVSEQAAFQYATALNALLASDKHRVQLGDTTVVFWTDQPETGADAALAEALGQWAPQPEDDGGATRSRLQDFLNRFRQATAAPTAGDLEHADAPFYALGLSPNAARISVRFWMRCTVKELAERLVQHVERLRIVGQPGGQTPSMWHLTRATARDSKEVKANIVGELTRSFLQDRLLPRSFLNALLQRVRVEGEVSPARAAGLKAYLLSNGINPMDVYLNKEHPSLAYHSGRIFATLAFAQEKALGSVNAGVVKKNFASAMATPGLTLGRLQRAAEIGHMHKLDHNLAEFIRDELTSANCRLLDGPPNNLGPDGQTLFALGFYQQAAYLRVVGGQVDKNKRYRSDLGEWMRSKLEVRVANVMNKANISYIYEASAILPNAGERWPDFVVRGGGDPENDVYIEVAGFPGEEYDKRHRLKLDAYRKLDITKEGGLGGRLIILDYREKDYDDKSVLDALNFLINPEPATASGE